ncbi:outer membrane protein assembly factor BamA [bacterium]|nr:outer membrane protein assembly factor BamA [bacterium]
MIRNTPKKHQLVFPMIVLSLLFCCFTMSYAIDKNKIIIKKINFAGNENIKETTLRFLIDSKEYRFYHRIFGMPYLDERLVKKDATIIHKYYLSKGYLNCIVKGDITYIPDKNEAYITFFITEGKQYFFKKLQIIGADFIDSKKVMEELKLKKGIPFDGRAKKEYKDQVQYIVQNYGYPYADVSLAIDSMGTNDIKLVLDIEPKNLAYMGKTYFKGNNHTKNFVIRRTLDFRKGDIYSLDAVRKTRDDLYKTGLFSYVKIEPIDFDQNPDTLSHNIVVFEKKSQWFGLGTAAGTNQTYDMTSELSLEWGHRNLKGTSRAINLKGTSQFHLITEWEILNNLFELNLIEPWIFNMHIPTTLKLYFEPGSKTEVEQYRIQHFGGQISSSYEPSRETMHSVTVTYERVDIYGIQDTLIEEQIRMQEGMLIQRKISYVYNKDKRDNLFTPTKGYSFNLSLEYAGGILGGDDDFSKIDVTFSKYGTLKNKIIFAQRLRGAIVGNFMKEKDILPHNRFFLGGANSIRGFKERGVGPKDDSGPLGGKVLVLLNLELRFPIIWRFWGNTFIDAGNLWAQPTEVHPEDLVVTAGWGLQFLTPVGPLRFEYGYRLKKVGAPPYSNWHLAILYAF